MERAIPTPYWLVSGYGLRAWRALACLVAVAGFLALNKLRGGGLSLDFAILSAREIVNDCGTASAAL